MNTLKIKIGLLAATVVAMLTASSNYAAAIIGNGGDDGLGNGIFVPTIRATPKDLQPTHGQLGQTFVNIVSLASTNSVGSLGSLVNSRGYIGGGDVSTNRLTDAAACYVVPVSPTNTSVYGLQWFDNLTTLFPSFLGEAGGTNAGSRIVALLGGVGSPDDYSWRVTSTDPLIGTASGPVATNSAGAARFCNPQFICVAYGPSGTNGTYWEPTQKMFVPGPGGTVFDGRQTTNVYPYQITVDAWYSFGPSIQIVLGAPADYIPIRNEFATTNQWLTIDLMRNGATVVSKTVYSAGAAGVIVVENPTFVRLRIRGGQMNMPYDVFSSTNAQGGPWNHIDGVTVIPGSQGELSITNDLPMNFFRLLARVTPITQQ